MNYNIRYLFGAKENLFKANLHSRSSFSDGKLSPCELKSLYKDNGYSILAITDNEPGDYSDLSDNTFLILPGFDFGTSSKKIPGVPTKSCTFTAISLKKEPERIREFYAEYGSGNVDAFLEEYQKNGYFITYDHPIRSLEILPDFLKYKHINAMEIINYSSLCEGYDEYNGIGYEQFLRYGNKIFCIAADGNRNLRPADSERSDSLGAFTVINADSLDYESVANALSGGSFYSSEGPLINSIWVKGNSLNIRCSEIDKIFLSTGRKAVKSIFANSNAPLTAVTFKISPEDIFIRLTLVDKKGRRAYTNAYYTDKIFSE